MKNLFVVFFLISSVSCTSAFQAASGPQREVAQEAIAEDFETQFQNLFNQQGSDFGQFFERVVSIYYRAHKFSMDFDQELARRIQAKPSPEADIEPMVTSDAYKKLYVMRGIHDRTHQKLTYFYRRLLEEAYRNEGSRERKQRAHSLMAELFRSVRLVWTEKPLGRAAMIDLFRELQREQSEFVSTARSLKISEENNQFRQFLANAPLAEARSRTGRTAQQLAAVATEESLKPDPEFEQELESTEFIIERQPQQSSKIAPGVGASGNINGSQFPRGTWALTYDDGPSGNVTPRILDMLKANNVKATFFWLSRLAVSQPSIVNRANREGHHLANHSFSHADLSRQATDRNKEIVQSTDALAQAYGYSPQYFRCPYGACIFNSKTAGSQEARRLIADKKMVHVLWNVDSNDWKPDSPEAIYQRTRDQVNNLSRGIILFHDLNERSFLASKKLVEQTLNGKRMVRINDIVNELNKSP